MPRWTYPVVILVAGAALAHLALYASRRPGAATALAVTVFVAQVPVMATYVALFRSPPVLGSHLLLLAPALGLDAWYLARPVFLAGSPTYWKGALIFSTVYFAVALPYIKFVMTRIGLDASAALLSVAIGVPAALVSGLLAARLASWLRSLGDQPHAARVAA
jgi:hypothetical protein